MSDTEINTDAELEAAIAAEAEAEAQAQAQGVTDPTLDNANPPVETPATETPAVDGETPAEGETEAKVAGPRTTYEIKSVGDELPESDPGGRANMYHSLLTVIVNDEDNWGKWSEVAEFTTPTGANAAKKALEAGERSIPAGEWEFAERKFQNPDNPLKRISKLYARYLGA